MSVLAIIAALVIEQWRPLGERKSVSGALAGWATYLERAFNGGERQHGMVERLVVVVPARLLVLGVVLSFPILPVAGEDILFRPAAYRAARWKHRVAVGRFAERAF